MGPASNIARAIRLLQQDGGKSLVLWQLDQAIWLLRQGDPEAALVAALERAVVAAGGTLMEVPHA